MQSKKFKSLGVIFSLMVPETAEEFDSLAKKSGACVAEAISSVAYRSCYNQFRDMFLHGREAVAATDTTPAIPEIKGVEQITGLKRATKPALDKDGKAIVRDGEPVTEYDEKESKYLERVIAHLVASGRYPTEEDALASFESLAEEVGNAIVFDPSASETKEAGPKKLAAKFKLGAARAIAKGEVDKANAKFATTIKQSFTPTNDTSKMYDGKYPDKDADNNPIEVPFNVSDKDAETLGWLIKKHSDFLAAQAAASLLD
jgi:hypothetical protein